jgi:Family of unknown function (DUF6918)
MASLKDLAQEPETRRAVVEDACRVLDLEVKDKGGVSGLAIKAGYKLVQGVKPGFVRNVVDDMLDDFLDALDPIYQEAVSAGKRPSVHLRANGGRVADALLGITDRRAENARRAAIKGMYEKLRPSAKRHVEAAAPRLADLLDKHAPPV